MGNVIPWSQIHPSITSQEPFVAVVIIDPQRQICVSEMVPFDLEALGNPDVSASEVIAAAQVAAANASGGDTAGFDRASTGADTSHVASTYAVYRMNKRLHFSHLV